MTRRHGRPRWWPKKLRRQLVLGVSAIVSVALLAVAALTVFSLNAYVTETSDAEVSRSLTAFSHSYTKYRDDAVGSEAAGPIPEAAMTEFVGQASGNLIAVMRNGEVIGCVVFSDGEASAALPGVAEALEDEPWAGSEPRTVRLAGMGPYRLQSQTLDTGERLISGVELGPAHDIVARKMLATAVLLVVALALTAAGTILVVRYALRPLSRVATTAGNVAALPLGGDDQRTEARVHEKDTDLETEVGTVGATLNRLLDNVDSALAERAESDRRIRQFLTDASHELRTPLAAIGGYAELTRQDSAALPDTTEYALARIESEAGRMTRLVDDLLLLSRLDERQDLETDDVDLCDLAFDAVNDIVVSAPTHRWLLRLPPEPVWVRGDRVRLHQIIGNLLNNARVHTPPGVTVTTVLAAYPADEEQEARAVLTVTDDGPDIDSSLLPNLFERFVQADKSRSRELGSTGLGLAIVAAIVEAHNGSVTVTSSGGETVFTVTLPLCVDRVHSALPSALASTLTSA